MGIIKAIGNAIGGGLADQWLEVIEPDEMDAILSLPPVCRCAVASEIPTERELLLLFPMDR